MRENFTQAGTLGADNRIHIDGDWYARGIPGNVVLAENVYIDTSYGFAGFRSELPEAMVIDEASGCYDRASMIVSKQGKVRIGKYTILNGSTLVCNQEIIIGNHCMLAWGSVLTDSWIDPAMFPVALRREMLKRAGNDPQRTYPFFNHSAPVVLEDNCWVGFDAVVLPGVRLGRGCVVGCKTIVDKDVPPYAVVTGYPAKIVKYLPPSDQE